MKTMIKELTMKMEEDISDTFIFDFAALFFISVEQITHFSPGVSLMPAKSYPEMLILISVLSQTLITLPRLDVLL